MLRSIRLKNFRSLRDTGEVELRPIVLLVGANSSGKSSFLRFFPLLRQTAEQKSSGPLLWFHDEGYVDFKDFRTTLCRDANEPVIEIGGEFMWPCANSGSELGELRFKGIIRGQNGHSNLTDFMLGMWGDSLTLRAIADGEVVSAGVARSTAISFKRFIPELLGAEALRFESLERLTALVAAQSGRDASRELWGALQQLDHGTAAYTLRELRAIEGFGAAWQGFTVESPEVHEIKRLTLLSALGDHLDQLASDWREFALGVRYIGPFRREPERFYRDPEIDADEIFPNGSNLTMFLHSLAASELQAFSEWVRKYFGFGVGVRVEGQHITLVIDPSGDGRPEYNLVDMGFGISQVLPVIAQCWIAGQALERNSDLRGEHRLSILAIEQPELHLHPRHQYQLADMFSGLAKATKESGFHVPMVIETHSEAMIHRFGELIEEGGLDREAVSVLLFEKQPEGETTTIRQTEFDVDGVLKNWPLGFFR